MFSVTERRWLLKVPAMVCWLLITLSSTFEECTLSLFTFLPISNFIIIQLRDINENIINGRTKVIINSCWKIHCAKKIVRVQ
jgi:hypothetical protein